MKVFPMMCHVRAEATATRIDVYDAIGDDGPFGTGVSAKDFAAQLSTVKGPLDVHINSYGGSVKDGIAITSAIRSHNGPKRTIVDGMACSAASVIMQAGDERIVQPGAMVMIHDASAGVIGNATEMQKAADELDKFSDNIAQVYADRAGGTPEQWRAAMRNETWYTADEAVDAGLADSVGTEAAALPGELDLSAFASVPDRVMAQLRKMPVRAPRAAYQPQPYKREDWENVQCPVCGKYNDEDGVYCGQCGIELAGRDDVTVERAQGGDGDGTDAMNAAGTRVAEAALIYLREQAKAHGDLIDAASVDESDWDGPKAMSMAAKSDDPAATYKQICAGRRDGDPAKQGSWALPYKYPGKGPNAAGVRNALSQLPKTQGLNNEAAAKELLQRLMKQINPDYDGGEGAGNRGDGPAWTTLTEPVDAAPAWLTQDQPAAPAWLNSAKEAK